MRTAIARQGHATGNRERILRTILREGALARVDLARHTGLTTAAITNITRELIERGLLQEAGKVRTERAGADPILLDLPPEAPLVGVVHQGVSALRIGLCNLRGQMIARKVIATPTRYTPSWAATTIAQTLAQLLRDSNSPAAAMVAVGAGLVGLVDRDRGLAKRAPSFGWEGVPLRAMIEEQLSCPVILENNVRAMAVGEALLGNGRAWSDFALVYVGTGIGSGLIIDGSAYRGAHGGAGEIGHITVDPEGEHCSCGNRGCLETIAAEPAMVRRARARGIDLHVPQVGGTKEAVRELVALARAGDAAAHDVITSCGESLGIALADLVDLFNPERIVLHGVITTAGGEFFTAVVRSLRQRAFLAANETIDLVTPTFGEDAGLVGAAAVALDAFFGTAGGADGTYSRKREWNA
jgi:predicted NBD/HSP70 family sugar kinase